MPRNVRNWWLELNVDGRVPTASGPQAKEGGFHLVIKQRSAGVIFDALVVDGLANDDGSLELRAWRPREAGHGAQTLVVYSDRVRPGIGLDEPGESRG